MAEGDVMLYLPSDEKSVRCEECGANVFRWVDNDRVRCNGCGTDYIAERATPTDEEESDHGED